MVLALSYFIFSAAPSGMKRMLMFLLTAPIWYDLQLTGSRGGMIATAILGAAVFARMTPKGRVVMIVTIILGLITATATLQRKLLVRYQTFFTAEDTLDPEDLGEEYTAATSATARSQLLKDSLWITLYHPIFGVGVGNFMPAAAEYQVAQGRRAMWHATHNTFTEISSELGIPGFIIYISIFVTTWRSLQRIRKKDHAHPLNREIQWAASAIQLALLSIAVSALFASVGYGYQLPLIAGLAAALAKAVTAESEPVPAAEPVAPALPEGRALVAQVMKI
jgi:O-antigen ligase